MSAGSTFHIDPNGTSAWNAVITGAKRWILFPPGRPPPGVHPSADGAEVVSPVSIKEWLLNFFLETPADQRIQGVCHAGEVMFVPSGWWHMVFNLEDSIALTQNYVSTQNLVKVLSFLKNKPEQVSGVPKKEKELLHARFLSALRNASESLDLNLADIEKQVAQFDRCKSSLWNSLTATPDSQSSSNQFSFDFCVDAEESLPC